MVICVAQVHTWYRLLGILETNFSGRSTRKDLSIRKSKSTFASAKMVMDLCDRTFNNKEKFYL